MDTASKDRPVTKKGLKRKRAEEQARTAALFDDQHFFAVDLVPDQEASARLVMDEQQQKQAQEDREQAEAKAAAAAAEGGHGEDVADDSSQGSDDDEDEMDMSMNLSKVESDPETDEEELSIRHELETQNDPHYSRYYAPIEVDKTRQCTRCKEYGHLLQQCPHDACNVCGQLDDHVAKNCPHKQCKRCGEKGHEASRCPSLLRRGGGGCDRCGRRTHVSTACPTIWRRYVKLPHDERPPKRAIVYACYNCGSTSLNNGHFGMECPYPRGHPGPIGEGNPFTNGDGRPEVSKPWPAGYSNKITANRPPPPTAPARRPHIVNDVRQNQSQHHREPLASSRQDYDDLLANVHQRNRSQRPPPPAASSRASGSRSRTQDPRRPAPRIQPLLSRLGEQVQDAHVPEAGSSRRAAADGLPPRPPQSYQPEQSRSKSYESSSNATRRAPTGDDRRRRHDDHDSRDDRWARGGPPPSRDPVVERDPRRRRVDGSRSGAGSLPPAPPPPPPRTEDMQPDFAFEAGAGDPAAEADPSDPWASRKNTNPTHQQLIDRGEMRAPTNGMSFGRKPKNRTAQTMKSDYTGGHRIKGLASVGDQGIRGASEGLPYDDWDGRRGGNGNAGGGGARQNSGNRGSSYRPNSRGSRGGGRGQRSRSYLG